MTRIWRPGRRWRIWTTTICYCCSDEIRTPRPPEDGWYLHRGQPAWYCPSCLGKHCSYSLAHVAACTCPVPDEAKR